MSRTTEWWDCSNGLWGANLLKGVDEQTALTKLAAYEDAAPEPQDVAALRSALARAERERDAALADIAEIEHVFGGTWRGRHGAEPNGGGAG